MSDEDALLSAIAAHPGEDTPRLMYADWLDEHGQPVRAEFIRVQVEIARLESLSREAKNGFIPLYVRHQQLLDNHFADLLGPLAPLQGNAEVVFHRGFVSAIEFPVGTFLSHAALVAGQRPLPDIAVTGVVGRLPEFLRNPHTDCVTRIRGYAAGGAAPHYPDDADDSIGAIRRMTRLEELDLENCGVNDRHCELAFDVSVPSLRDLDLSYNLITDGGVRDLLRTDLPRQLTHLVLGGNEITDVGAVALAEQWPTGAADRLENLNLRRIPIGPAGQRALLNRFGGRVRLF
jgi:uncharacterized protein (TIGR02996 family)